MLSHDHDGSQVYLFAQTFEHYSYLSTTVTVLLTRALIYHHTRHDQPQYGSLLHHRHFVLDPLLFYFCLRHKRMPYTRTAARVYVRVEK